MDTSLLNTENNILCDYDDVSNILTIKIQRNGKKNALTRAMYTALDDNLKLAESSDVRCVVLTGADDCFTAGNDITDFLYDPPKDESSPVLKFLKTLSQFSKPLIAAANGPAIGVGTTILLHCDYVVLGPDILLKLPFVELGLCPEAASSLLLPRHIGYLRASEMIICGARINAAKALEFGLANEVAENPLEAAMVMAHHIAEQPLNSLVISKKMLKSEIASEITSRLKIEGEAFVDRLKSPEAIEAFTAFLQKRKANFRQF